MISAVMKELNEHVIGESTPNIYFHVAPVNSHWFWFVKNWEMGLCKSGEAPTRVMALTAMVEALELVKECRRRIRPPISGGPPEIKILVPKGETKMRRTTTAPASCNCAFHRYAIVHICSKCKVIYSHGDDSHRTHGGIETYDSWMYAHDDEVNDLRDKAATYAIDVTYANGSTPLHFAVMRRNMALIRALIQHVDINAKDNKWKTPLDWAVDFGLDGIADFLRNNGARSGSRRSTVPQPAQRQRRTT